MAVEAVVGDVELAVAEPLRDRGVRPVEGRRERLVPVQQPAGLVGPEGQAVLARAVVEVGLGDRGRRELRARREPTILMEEVVDRILGR
jgi:hypothetical protein